MAQNSTAYPFMGEVAAERGGILELPAVDTNLLVAPTETWTHLAAAFATTTLGTAALVSGGLGYMKHKFNGTVYRVPIFVNS